MGQFNGLSYDIWGWYNGERGRSKKKYDLWTGKVLK
jgi:hypothetical protein